ncbi:pectinesterase family protein [Evansella sp. AB-rgal1]|uniref:pectinesterase family protein n=1 Tax=Evansella sp. AB-rgal1 TaxID=3242696 RepID=UPI00359D5E59
MIVAKDGSGNFTAIQEAIDSIPEKNEDKVIIQMKGGIYEEKLIINKPFVVLEGMENEEVIISFGDYAKKLGEGGAELGTFGSYSTLITGANFYAKNITFRNDAGPGTEVGQALAMYVDADKCRFEDCSFLGSQDTIFLGPLPPKPMKGNSFGGPREGAEKKVGHSYFNRCYIQGDVDFIFGSGVSVFENCEIFSLDRGMDVNGYITAASTPKHSEFGFVFINCRLTSNAAADSVYLGRPWRDFAKTVFINCWMGEHIKREGWDNWNKSQAETTTYYGEYNSHGPGGNMDARVSWARVLTEQEVKQFSSEKILDFLNSI